MNGGNYDMAGQFNCEDIMSLNNLLNPVKKNNKKLLNKILSKKFSHRTQMKTI